MYGKHIVIYVTFLLNLDNLKTVLVHNTLCFATENIFLILAAPFEILLHHA